MPEISFSNVRDNRIREIFLDTCQQYDPLQNVKLTLEQERIKGSTMQAQPILGFRSLWNGIDAYRIRLAIYVRDSQEMRVDELPDDILKGWFAHELGHVIDYQNRSFWQMLGFGLQYLTSSSFRKSAEHRADEIAIRHGFSREIIETKKFLFHHDLIDEKYRRKMQKYYMSIAEVEDWLKKNVDIDPIN